MSINDEWVRYLRASGYTGSLNDMMRQALTDELAPAPAPTCTITLTGDIAAAVGGQPMTISGQTASYTLTETPTIWLASTPMDSPFMPPESGVVICEAGIERDGGAVAGARISSLDPSTYIACARLASPANKLVVGVFVEGESVYANASLDDSAVVALGMDSSGNPAIYADGVPLDLSSTGWTVDSIFSGGAILAAIDDADGASGSGSITFRTAGDAFTQTYPAGTLDWCGNPI